MIKYIVVSVFVFASALEVDAQIKANAVSYTLDVDLNAFAPGNDFEEDYKCEVDAYYTSEKLKTMVRVISKPEDFELTIMQRLYDVKSNSEYNINHEEQLIYFKKDHFVKPKATGKKKIILGHACKEYTFTDHRNITFYVWVAEKLQKNICPAGNFNINGTALELTTSNGLHYVATDVAEGELPSDFFELPKAYREEVIAAPAVKR